MTRRSPFGFGTSLLITVLVALLGAIGVLGAVISFTAVRQAMEPSFGRLAWTVPIGVDIGIVLFTAWDLLLTRLEMRPLWLRLVPWGLVCATIYLNVAPSLGHGDLHGAVGHAVLPALWVISVELAAHVVRWSAGLGMSPAERRAAGRMDRVRPARFLFAPVSSIRILRLMIVCEIRSYPHALELWRGRRRLRGAMAKEFGRLLWRWRAPLEQRDEYRFGLLTSTDVRVVPKETVTPNGQSGSTRATRKARKAKAVKRKDQRPALNDAELTELGQRIFADHAARGEELTYTSLVEAVRTQARVGNSRIADLHKQLHG